MVNDGYCVTAHILLARFISPLLQPSKTVAKNSEDGVLPIKYEQLPVDHATNTVLAYVFGKRKDEVFKKLKALLEPYGIKKFYTDDWGAYERHLDENTRAYASISTFLNHLISKGLRE